MALGGWQARFAAMTLAFTFFSVVVLPAYPVAGDEFEDIGDVDGYWWVDTSTILFNAGDPINHSIAFRFEPWAIDPRADRIYIASGNKLIALRPATGQMGWHLGSPQAPVCCFETSSEISTDPLAANFGSVENPNFPKYVVYIGTSDGSVYFLREAGIDEIDPLTRRSHIPEGEDVLVVQADGSVTSIGVYADLEASANHGERVYFGTSEGWLYAYPGQFEAATWDEGSWYYDFDSSEWWKGFEQDRPYRRVEHSLVYDSTRETVHLFGGKGDLVNTELWSLDNTMNWTEADILYDQFQVDYPALVYYESADAFLLFGGEAWWGDVSQLLRLNLTENEWHALSPSANPPPRHGHRVIYDGQEDLMMLFGGLSDGAALNDTWLYSLANNTWWNVSTANPSGRFGHSLVYDSLNDRAILFGGSDGNQILNDTWAFDFLTRHWAELSTGLAPLPRLNHSMAFDPLSGEALLFGGKNDTEALGDTWTLNVSADMWEKKNPSTSPPARFSHSIAVNRSTSRAVLFGGDLWRGNELWKRKFGDGPVEFAGVPLGPANCPRKSPALSYSGTIITLNDGTGHLRALNASNGNDIWSVWMGDPWATAPTVSFPMTELGDAELVAAGSSDGWLYAFYVENGTVYPEWDALGKSSPLNPSLHGIQIEVDGIPDGGTVTSLAWWGLRLLVGTSSKYFHEMDVQAVGNHTPGWTRWSVRTAGTVASPAIYGLGYDAYYFVDDSGRLQAVEGGGLIGFRIKLNGNATATPTMWKDEQGSGHLHQSVWIGDSLGHVYSYSAGYGVETTPPSISDMRANPSPQEVHRFVNVSAVVEDASGVSDVWVDIDGVGNFSTTWDSTQGRYYYNQTYSNLGTYDFTIAAKDVRDNWATVSSLFAVEDTTPPVISHLPVASAEVHEAMDTLATVIDNFEVSAVTLNYTDVGGSSCNVTMTPSGDNYTFQIPAQNTTGTVTYSIWSEDTEGNTATTQIYATDIVPDTSSPFAPTDLVVTGGEKEKALSLTWTSPTNNTDGSPLVDLAGYNVYRMTSSGGERTLANPELILNTTFEDTGLESGKTYHYVVRAVDAGGNESPDSNEASGSTISAGLDD